MLSSKIALENLGHHKSEKSSYSSLCLNSLQLPSGIIWRNSKTIGNFEGLSYTFKTATRSIKLSLLVLLRPTISGAQHAKRLLKWCKVHERISLWEEMTILNKFSPSSKSSINNTRWFKYDRDWFVCKQAALRSSCATLREWSHNLHPPSCSG